MQFFKDNFKLKLVEGFKMPEQEYVKGEAGKQGSFKKTGGEVQMYKRTFVEQNEFKGSIVFNTKEDIWNKFEESGELLILGVDVLNDPFTGKLKTPKLNFVKPMED